MEFEVHPTSIVDPTAIIKNNCKIGPYAIIEEDGVLGENCQKIDKLLVFEELWFFGRSRQMCLERWPPKF